MRWYEMEGQPNRDSNPVPPSQGNNHATNWANEAGLCVPWSNSLQWQDKCIDSPMLLFHILQLILRKVFFSADAIPLTMLWTYTENFFPPSQRFLSAYIVHKYHLHSTASLSDNLKFSNSFFWSMFPKKLAMITFISKHKACKLEEK